MKTAIPSPDDVFADADQLARELKKSRRRLYAAGIGLWSCVGSFAQSARSLFCETGQ